jgi:capsular exopolysaccharide synthesis family protein
VEPRRYLLTLRKHWPALVGLTLLGALVAGGYALTQPTLYSATSSVFLSAEQGKNATELVQGSTYTLNTVQSYAQLATTPAVLEPVIKDLRLNTTAEELSQKVTSAIRLNTVIIDVTAKAGTAKDSAAVANAVTAQLGKEVKRLSPVVDEKATPAAFLEQVAAAAPPSSPSEPRTALLLSAGAAIGLLLGILYAVLRELFDTRFRTEDETREVVSSAGVPFLGGIARRQGRDLPNLAEPNSAEAEDYRRLCANLEFAGVDQRIRSVTVSSPLAGAGKTTTALNIAAAIAERGHRVLLLDADLRRPSVAEYVNIEGAVGLTNVLLGGVSAEDAIQKVGQIDVLPSGTTPPNVTGLLTSQSMQRLFVELQSRYEYIVVDSPPVLAVPDALTIAKLTDGVLLVARQKATKAKQLLEAVQSLTFVNETVLGVVLNAVPGHSAPAYGADTAERAEDTGVAAAPPQSFFRESTAKHSRELKGQEGLEKVGVSDS